VQHFFVWGANNFGQLGIPTNAKASSKTESKKEFIVNPTSCSFNAKVKQIACGETSSHILSEEGFVYSMGSNKDGRLGLGISPLNLPATNKPQLVKELSQITKLACGLSHILALDCQFQAFGWGQAENGALGMRLSNSLTPILVQIKELRPNMSREEQVMVKDIACGGFHSFFTSIEGDIFGCGLNEYGQLGCGIKTFKEYQPVKLITAPFEEDQVKQISCGLYHSSFLTEQGLVYACGDNTKGQLCLDPAKYPSYSCPSQLKGLSLVKKVQSTKFGGVALTFRGDLYQWGPQAKKLETGDVPIKEIHSHFDTSLAVDIDNNLLMWSAHDTQINGQVVSQKPSFINSLKGKSLSKVFVGSNLFFGLCENQSFQNAWDLSLSHSSRPPPCPNQEQRYSSIQPNLQKKSKAVKLGNKFDVFYQSQQENSENKIIVFHKKQLEPKSRSISQKKKILNKSTQRTYRQSKIG